MIDPYKRTPKLEDAKSLYIIKRLIDPEKKEQVNGKPNLDPQIHYFENKLAKAQKSLHFYRPILKYTGIIALIVVICAVFYKASHLGWNILPSGEPNHHYSATGFSPLSFLIYFLPIALPLVAGIAIALTNNPSTTADAASPTQA